MKNKITIITAMISFVCSAQLLTEEDKKAHVLAGGFFAAPTSAITFNETGSYKKSFLNGVYASVLVGVGKEVYDSSQSGNRFDNRDVLATVIGGIVSSALTTSVSYLINKKKR